MKKTLTEQWKNGKLNDGWYYLKVKSELGNCPVISECVTNYSHLEPYSDFYEYDDSHVEEVLAPVPSYEEYRELLDLNVYEKDRKKVMGLEDKVKRLQEQLKEANEAIMSMVGNGPYKADEIGQEYLDKWGVK